MKNGIGFWIVSLALAGFSFLGFSSCNVSDPEDTYILRMRLDDSLTVERNLFQSIDIDLFDGNDSLTHADIFHGPYHKADSAKLANLVLKSKLPDPVTIRITAYKSAEDFWVFTIKISSGNQVTLPPAHTGPIIPVVPNPGDTLAPNRIFITSPTTPFLYLGDSSISLSARAEPSTATQTVTWSLVSGDAAVLESGNKLKALKTGNVTLKAASTRDISIFATMEITVQDPPTVPPESITLGMATPMVLAAGVTDGDLVWTVLPAGTDQKVEWTSSDITVAQITTDNKVRPLKKGEAKITGKSKAKSTVTASFDVKVIVPVKVDAISILPKSLTLYTGGPEGKLTVTLTGNDSGAQYTLGSSDFGVATVSAAGSVKGVTAGAAVITATVVGYPAVTSICSVRVVKDAPVVTVSPNQNVAFNGEAVFTVSVAPQAYGATVEIKADMDGDNVFEQTVLNKETADFKQKYTEVKSTTVSFKVKDTEGNEETVTRKVTVGAPGAPIVSIVNPSKDTAINSLSLKIRFTIKDTAQKIDTYVDSTVILIAGTNKVLATRKNDGGVGSDEVAILVDMAPPAVAITGPAAQTTGVAAFSLAGTAGDLESGLLSVAISGALSGNGSAILADGEWSKGGLTLAEGANTLVATALDKAGNTKTASVTVTLDSKKPGVPVVTAPAAVRAGPIKWTWTKANADGSGKFKVKINAGPEIDATLAEYTLAATGMVDGTVYGLSVKETDPIAGDGPWSAEKKVLYDSKKPSPSISVTATPTKTPEWKWTGNGGVGTFRWHYKGQTAGSAGTGIAVTFAPTTLATGSYNLCVQEKDSPEWGEEWGTESCAALDVDKTGPSITAIQYPDGYATNQTTLTIGFNADGAPKSYACPLGTDKAQNTCTLSASDALGNTTTAERKIWRRSNVAFVRAGATGGGTNFDDAFGSLRQALSQLGAGQNQIWIMEGTYAMTGTDGPYLPSGISIYGGFSTNRNQGSVGDRNPSANRTVLSSRWEVGDDFSREIFNIRNGDGSQVSNILLDGMTMSAGYTGLNIDNATGLVLSNILFTNSTAEPILGIRNSTVTLNDCEFSNNSGGIMTIYGNTVTMNRCKFSNNQTSAAAFYLAQGKAVVSNSTFLNSAGFSGFQYWITVDVSESTPILEMYNNSIQGLGGNPGPIVTNNGDKFTFVGSGNN